LQGPGEYWRAQNGSMDIGDLLFIVATSARHGSDGCGAVSATIALPKVVWRDAGSGQEDAICAPVTQPAEYRYTASDTHLMPQVALVEHW
jgi:hypothetical protein